MPRSPAVALLFIAVLAAPSAHAQEAASNRPPSVPGPVFSDTGPDAALYGAAAGYPLGPRESGAKLEYLVAAYSHFDELVAARKVLRAATPWNFKRAPEPALSYTFSQSGCP